MIITHGNWWLLFLLLPLLWMRPWRRRRPVPPWDWDWHGRGREPTRASMLDESVRARLEMVDQLETRVSELENRLDFAERLLAERREIKAVESH